MTENNRDNNNSEQLDDPLAFMDQTFQGEQPQLKVAVDQETNQILTPIPSDACHSPPSLVFNKEDSDYEIEQGGVTAFAAAPDYQKNQRKMSDQALIHIQTA